MTNERKPVFVCANCRGAVSTETSEAAIKIGGRGVLAYCAECWDKLPGYVEPKQKKRRKAMKTFEY